MGISPPRPASTEVTQFYAIAAGGVFAGILILRFLLYVAQVVTTFASVFILRHVQYPYFLRRHRLLGPWTRSSVALQIFYWATTMFCTFFRVSDLADAGTRAGMLSLINTIPLYAGLHLSFVADLLGLSVRTYIRFHGAVGIMAGALALVHVSVAVSQHTPGAGAQIYALLVS